MKSSVCSSLLCIRDSCVSLSQSVMIMIMEMVSNRSFTLTTGNSKRSRLRPLKKGVPQGSVVAPLLFNIYISDLTTTVSRKYAYADDLAIMHADGNLQAVEGVLSKDMALSLFDGRRNDESDPSSYLWRWDCSWLYNPMRDLHVRPQVGHR